MLIYADTNRRLDTLAAVWVWGSLFADTVADLLHLDINSKNRHVQDQTLTESMHAHTCIDES